MNLDFLCPHCFQETLREGVCRNCGFQKHAARRDLAVLPYFTILKERYLIGEVLGAGGFGITYLACDMFTAERKAIKEYYPRSIAFRGENSLIVGATGAQQQKYFQTGLQKFWDEARILHSVGGIKAVVRVDDYFNANGTAYMVMEYVDGVALLDICKSSGGTVPFAKANSEFVDLAITLDEVHMKHLLHRDVSPHNVILLPDGGVKLIDFGAARYHTDQQNKSMTVFLKPGFAPLEQYTKKGVQGPWTDIYGLACTMYWYITGVKVPDAPSRLEGKKIDPVSKLRPDIPKGFTNVMDKAMAIDYRNRYQSVSEMLGDLNSVTALLTEKNSKPVAAPEPMGKTIKDWFRKRDDKKQMLMAQIMGGPFDGYLYPFSENGSLVIGRNSEFCNAVLPVNMISRLHCTIRWEPENQRLTLTDQSSTGTFLGNGQRLQQNESVPIALEQPFYLASREYTMRILRMDV